MVFSVTNDLQIKPAGSRIIFLGDDSEAEEAVLDEQPLAP